MEIITFRITALFLSAHAPTLLFCSVWFASVAYVCAFDTVQWNVHNMCVLHYITTLRILTRACVRQFIQLCASSDVNSSFSLNDDDDDDDGDITVFQCFISWTRVRRTLENVSRLYTRDQTWKQNVVVSCYKCRVAAQISTFEQRSCETRRHTHKHTHTHARTHAHTNTHTHTHTQTHTHARTHARTHTHAHTHTHTHTHKHEKGQNSVRNLLYVHIVS